MNSFLERFRDRTSTIGRNGLPTAELHHAIVKSVQSRTSVRAKLPTIRSNATPIKAAPRIVQRNYSLKGTGVQLPRELNDTSLGATPLRSTYRISPRLIRGFNSGLRSAVRTNLEEANSKSATCSFPATAACVKHDRPASSTVFISVPNVISVLAEFR